MGPDDHDSDDPAEPGVPLPPDDRLWRHPSEVREHGIPGRPIVATAAPRGVRPAWQLALVAGLTGAVLSTGILAASGALSPRRGTVVEKVAVSPVMASPMMGGPRGVVAVAERISPAIVRLDIFDGEELQPAGSGVVYRSDGLTITSAHVVDGAERIHAELTDGRYLECELVGVDAMTDIAVVRLGASDLPVAVLGSVAGLEVGADTIAIGSALGFDGAPSVTTGIVSALLRQVRIDGGEMLHGMIQTDAPIAPGSSGGALLDSAGAVVGITIAVASDTSSGFGFAVPIDLARKVAARLVADGRMTHSWLGVEGRDYAKSGSAGTTVGALVRQVAPDSPAARAGITSDDIITEVNGKPVESISEVVVALRQHEPGDEVTIGYWRGDQHTETSVVLAERP